MAPRAVWKHCLTLGLLVLVCGLCVGGFVLQRIESQALAEAQETLRSRAVALRDRVRPLPDRTALEELAESAPAEFGDAWEVLDRRGEVLVRHGAIGPGLSPVDTPWEEEPERGGADESGEGFARRRTGTPAAEHLFLVLPVRESPLAHYVRVSLPTSGFRPRVAAAREGLATGLAVACLLAVAVGVWLGRR